MPRLLGLDIDSRYVRMSIADVRMKRITYVRSEGVALPPDGEPRSTLLAQTLLQWKNSYNPTGVVIGLPLHLFSCKLIDMPAMSRDDMSRALPFEMEKHLPLAVDEYLIDFILTKTDRGTKPLVFSIKKDVISSLVKLVAEAGMEVSSVRCRAIDVLNSMAGITGDRKMSGLFVLTTDDAYEIAGISDTLPLFMKKISASAGLSGTLEELRQVYPGKIYCSGSVDQTTAEHFAMIKSEITVANALIYAAVHKSRLNLEFVPEEFRKPKKDFYPYIIGGLAVASFCLYILTGFVAYFKDTAALRGIESRISAIKTKASGVIEARKKLEALQDDRNVFLDFQSRSNVAVRVIRDLTSVTPLDSWIINLSVDEKGMVEAEGFSRKTADLITALDKSKLFKNISYAAPIISRDGEERFSLKFEVNQP